MPKQLRNALALYVDARQPGAEMSDIRRLPLDLIDPNSRQTRQSFDEAALEELTASVRIHGVLQPIGVRLLDARYRIIWGERRFRAAAQAGQADIPARIFADLTDEQADALTALENLQREDLDLEEEARYFAYLIETSGLSQRALADHLGKNRNYIRRRLWLLNHRPDLFTGIREGRISQHRALELADRPADWSTTSASELAHSEPLSTGDSSLAHSEPLSTDRSSAATEGSVLLLNGVAVDLPAESGGERTPRRAMPPPGPAPRWRALARARTWLGTIQPTTVPQAERAALIQELADLETQVALARRALLAQETPV